MPTSTNVTNLKINELTEAQYDAAVQGGVIGANELSILTDVDDAIQVATMPTAAAGEVGKVYQFIGTTDANYTHGYFYECVSDGQNPATYSWSQTNVQPGSSLPSQTGNAGKFLTTDGTDASWATISALQNTATGSNSLTILGTATSTNLNSINIGTGSSVSSQGAYDKKATVIGVNSSGDVGTAIIGCGATGSTYSVVIGASAIGGNSNVIIGNGASGTTSHITCIGTSASCSGLAATAIGQKSHANAQEAIQIGSGTNSTANTLSIGLSATANYKLLDSDGTIPTDRFTTTPVADGTYTPTVTISSGVATRSWAPAASAPVVPSTMPTLAVADWSSNTQTVNVTGVTASNVVFVSPAPASAADYAAAGIVCTAQGAGTLTFSCQTVPTNAITVNVVILG